MSRRSRSPAAGASAYPADVKRAALPDNAPETKKPRASSAGHSLATRFQPQFSDEAHWPAKAAVAHPSPVDSPRPSRPHQQDQEQKEVAACAAPAKREQPMAEAETLTAEQAESVVDELIERFGPGAYPKVTVLEVVPGTWRIRWRSMDVEAPAMSAEAWRDWLRERVGSIAPERLETSEG